MKTEEEIENEDMESRVKLTIDSDKASLIKIMRCLKKCEPEIYNELRESLFATLENAKIENQNL